MADLALAIATPVAATPVTSAAVSVTPGKAAAAATPADPFAILMAAAAPAAIVTPATVPLPVAANSDDAALPELAEKTGDDDATKDDGNGDTAASPDALLALLTPPTVPIVQPVPVAVPAANMTQIATSPAPAAQSIGRISDVPGAAPAPVISTPQTSTGRDPAIVETDQTVLASKSAAMIAQEPVPIAQSFAQTGQIPAPAPIMNGAPAPTVSAPQTSAQALIQALATQANAAPVQQAVAQNSAEATAPALPTADSSTDETIAATAAGAPSAPPAKGAVARAPRMIAPNLDAKPAVAGKVQTRADAPAARTPPAPAKADERDARPATTQAAADKATPQVQQPAAPASAAHQASATAKAADLGSVDATVTRHLAVARDGQWLDSLARDIAATGGGNSSLSFTLSPEHLGALKVDITQGSDGASVHMTTDNDTARNIILDAQPKLAAEARAQGLTIRESTVSTNSEQQRQGQNPTSSQAFAQSSGHQQPGGGHRRAPAPMAAPPLSSTLSTAKDEESDGDLYA